MQSPALNFSPRGLYIGGRWVSPAEGQSFASINPSNLEKLADVPAAGEADVDACQPVARGGVIHEGRATATLNTKPAAIRWRTAFSLRSNSSTTV